MIRTKARRPARERRLVGAVVALCIACAAILTVVLLHLWSTGDQNVAGWVTTFVVVGAAFLAWEALGFEKAYRRTSRRRQWSVIALTLALALGGSVAYVLWPGTASWYLASLPGIPAVLVLMSFPRNDDERAGPVDFGDGPWTAP
jgi:undecaprenyl pyrophosphate phosphatase UppP